MVAAGRSLLPQRRVAVPRAAPLRAPASAASPWARGRRFLHASAAVAGYVGLRPGRLYLQYEGLNPSGSFKDNGMAAAFSHARLVGASRAACASTGNTSASLALYCAVTRLMKGDHLHRFRQDRLRQTLAGPRLRRLDRADRRRLRRRHGPRPGSQPSNWESTWSTASIPSAWKGRRRSCTGCWKGSRWEVPDWIVVPGGNLGNSSAFGKAFHELHELGLIDRIPRLAVINAAGANTLYQLVERRGLRWNGGDVDTALDRPRSTPTWRPSIAAPRPSPAPSKSTARSTCCKCLRALEWCRGVVREVTDEEILDAKAQVGAGGLGCEPASAASVAGAKRLLAEGVIEPDQRVVCILTGHQLKDPTATVAYHTADRQQFAKVLGSRGVRRAAFANRPVAVANDLEEIVKAITRGLPNE